MTEDGRLPRRLVDMGVDLGGEDAFMSEHLLDDTEVRAVLDEMGRERMAESMRGYLLGYACEHGIMLHHVEYGYPAELRPSAVEKKDVIKA